MSKRCPRCGETKPLRDFYRNRSTTDGRGAYCKVCWKAYQQPRVVEWQKAHPGRVKEQRRKVKLKREYGLTPEQYEEMLIGQDGHCAICPCTPKKNGKRLAVDHDHKTGKVRGLLCSDHNRALGLLKDDPDLCLQAASYLKSHF